MTCPPIEQLFAFAHHQLPTDTEAGIRAHLDTGCDACRREIDELRQILSATANHGLSQPFDWLIYQAMNLFRWRQSTRHERVSRSRPALLLVNTSAEGWPANCRSGGSLTQHRLYRAGNYDIDLLIDFTKSARAANIIGQSILVGRGLDSVAYGDVQLLKDCHVAFVTKTNEVGRFMLDGIGEGTYDLKLRFNGEEIDIVGLTIEVEAD
jgi:hypothetical protein